MTVDEVLANALWQLQAVVRWYDKTAEWIAKHASNDKELRSN